MCVCARVVCTYYRKRHTILFTLLKYIRKGNEKTNLCATGEEFALSLYKDYPDFFSHLLLSCSEWLNHGSLWLMNILVRVCEVLVLSMLTMTDEEILGRNFLIFPLLCVLTFITQNPPPFIIPLRNL